MPTELQNRQHYQPLEQLEHKQLQLQQYPNVNMAASSAQPPNPTAPARNWELYEFI